MPEPARTVTREVSLTGVAYHRYRGADPCPDCQSRDVIVRSTGNWDHTTTPPTRTRYQLCRGCDRRFKSVEVGG